MCPLPRSENQHCLPIIRCYLLSSYYTVTILKNEWSVYTCYLITSSKTLLECIIVIPSLKRSTERLWHIPYVKESNRAEIWIQAVWHQSPQSEPSHIIVNTLFKQELIYTHCSNALNYHTYLLNRVWEYRLEAPPNFTQDLCLRLKNGHISALPFKRQNALASDT